MGKLTVTGIFTNGAQAKAAAKSFGLQANVSAFGSWSITMTHHRSNERLQDFHRYCESSANKTYCRDIPQS